MAEADAGSFRPPVERGWELRMRHGTAPALKDALRGARHGMAMGGAFVLRIVKIVLPPIGYLGLRGRAMRTEGGMWRRGIRICTIMTLLCLFTACASTRTEDDLFFVNGGDVAVA